MIHDPVPMPPPLPDPEDAPTQDFEMVPPPIVPLIRVLP
jgi:hypothetical protein